MKHPDYAVRVAPEALNWLRSLPLNGPADEVAAVQAIFAWLEQLNLADLGPRASEAFDEFNALYAEARDLQDAQADLEAIAFTCRLMLFALAGVEAAHDAETGNIDVSEPPISREEFRRRHIAPLNAESRRLVRALRRRYRVPHGRVRGARGCGHRRVRRNAAQRAAGVRSGTDPGDPELAQATRDERLAVVA